MSIVILDLGTQINVDSSNLKLAEQLFLLLFVSHENMAAVVLWLLFSKAKNLGVEI